MTQKLRPYSVSFQRADESIGVAGRKASLEAAFRLANYLIKRHVKDVKITNINSGKIWEVRR